ncbi:MAG TPA: prepilin-type cleavage/methylation domain-containing protein [Desulfuromonadales bacterium]|nr:prepilin-type cleavage/methylation domain-containing protein [Desulfuromonadales bacterium]
MKNNSGFTLIEILITMALVIVVLVITGSAFESILKSSGRLLASEESNIEGVIGLEMFRHDLQQAGFGLPHAFVTAPKYGEAKTAPANLLNDGKGGATGDPSGNVPRAIASLESLTGTSGNTYNVLSGTDYLAVKASTIARNSASQKWTFLSFSASSDGKGRPPNKWSNSSDNFESADKVIVLNRSFTTGGQVTNTLVNGTVDPANYWASYPAGTDKMADTTFIPTKASDVYYLYGITGASELRMPFNRADYFVARPQDITKIPSTCAPLTGILYKAGIGHGSNTSGGVLDYMPLLDCVADMQIVFGWDINGNGTIDESSAYDTDATKITVSSSIGTTSGTIKTMMENPEEIRYKLKYIKVYIMAQEGRKDTNFSNSDTLVNNTLSVVVGDAGPTPASNVSVSKGYTSAQLTAKGWQNYRWKIYRIVVRPKNLISS